MPRGRPSIDCPNATYVGADYTPDECDFLRAIDAYKRRHQRPFPTWREVLAVLESLGWRRVEGAGPLPCPQEIRSGLDRSPERR